MSVTSALWEADVDSRALLPEWTHSLAVWAAWDAQLAGL